MTATMAPRSIFQLPNTAGEDALRRGHGSSAVMESSQQRFERAFQDHADFVFRTCRRVGLDAATAEDATQQVFIIVATKLATVPLGKERAFLYVTACNVAANVRRSLRRRREDLVMADAIDPLAAPDERLHRERAMAIADRILDAMEFDLRMAFVLAEVEQLSFTEMAEVLDLPRGTVASRVRRAKEDFDQRVQRIKAQMTKGGA